MKKNSTPAIYADQIRMLYSQAPLAYSINTVCAVLFAVFLWPVAAQTKIVVWLAAMLTLMVFRYALLYWFRRAANADGPAFAAKSWYRPYLAGVFLTGLMWGIAAHVFFLFEAPQYQIFLTLILAGLCAGAVMTHSARWEASVAFAGPALLPLALQFLSLEEAIHRLIGWLMVVFLLSLLYISRTAYRVFAEMLDARASVAGLLSKSETQQKRLADEAAERERSQEALQISEERMELVLKGADLGSWDWDVRNDQIVVNHRWADMLGYSLAEVNAYCGNFWQSILHPDDKTRTLAALHAHVEGKTEFYEAEYRMRSKSGAWLWVLARGKAVARDESARAVRITGTHLDITKRKNAERALSESEEHFRNLVEGSIQGIYVHREWRLLFANQAAADILGYAAPQEMIDAGTLDTWVAPHERERLRGYYDARMNRRRAPRQYQIDALRKDGAQIVLEIRVSHIPWYGKPAVLATMIDMTEHKRAEAELRRINDKLQVANEELATAARAKDEFLAGMSHELRTPLAAVMGISEILQNGIHGPINGKQRQYLQHIYSSGEHLLALINDILDVARLGAGELKLLLDDIDVAWLCQDSLQMIRLEAQKKNQRMTAHIDDAVQVIRADERRLKQILVNLLSNAVKFTPDGGEIGLEVIGDTTCSGYVSFVIWDKGIGISEEAIERMFKPFEQLDSSLSRQYSGSGLGLSLAYQLVKLHGGNISVESQLGEGTRFTVMLPWDQTSGVSTPDSGAKLLPNDAPAIVADRPQGDDYKPDAAGDFLILLAEDNRSNALTISEYLQANGFRVLIAGDGGEAIELARTHLPDLILMDIQMPGMDGLEAIRCLRDDEVFAEVPIIALTALVMQGDRERCMAAGANDYLSKPLKLSYLLEFLTGYLSKEKVAGAGDTGQ